MTLKSHLVRAQRGVREEAKLYVVAVSSLTIAFLCLSAALLGLTNLSDLAERWGRTHRMSIYLAPNAAPEDVERLRTVLGSLPAVGHLEHLTPEKARAEFLRDTRGESSLADLPIEVFPASIEIEFVPAVTAQKIDEVATKVQAFTAAVEQVDTYKSWFTQLAGLIEAGRMAASGIAVLVVVCVFAVVSNTIRLSVANRRDEIELLRMCGATDGFVRGPFVAEGGIQGLASAGFAMLLLGLGYLVARPQLDAALTPFTGVPLAFLHPGVVATLVIGGGVIGALGGALAIRRYMQV